MGLSALVPALYSRLARRFQRIRLFSENAALIAIVAPWLGIFSIWFLALGVAPVLVQWLRVQPSEITLEAPYIAHNIEFTRRAFKLHNVEAREFAVSPTFTQETLNNNQYLLSEVRLWDWRALEAVYKQFQEIRLYYEFTDVDVDRYQTSGGYRQVMVSAREMKLSNLPLDSQTFVNLRFKYTHGYGITMAPVSDFTADGLPNLLIKDIPPRTDDEKLRVTQPQIYYGELTDSHIFVNTGEAEFDYPKGDDNAYVNYAGSGGVRIRTCGASFSLAGSLTVRGFCSQLTQRLTAGCSFIERFASASEPSRLFSSSTPTLTSCWRTASYIGSSMLIRHRPITPTASPLPAQS